MGTVHVAWQLETDGRCCRGLFCPITSQGVGEARAVCGLEELALPFYDRGNLEFAASVMQTTWRLFSRRLSDLASIWSTVASRGPRRRPTSEHSDRPTPLSATQTSADCAVSPRAH